MHKSQLTIFAAIMTAFILLPLSCVAANEPQKNIPAAAGNIIIQVTTPPRSVAASKAATLYGVINAHSEKYPLCQNRRMNPGSTETFAITPSGIDRVIDFINIEVECSDAWGPESFVFEFPDGKVWTFSGAMSLGSNKAKILKSNVRPFITFFFTGPQAGTCLTQTEFTTEDPPWMSQVKGICMVKVAAGNQTPPAAANTAGDQESPTWGFNNHSYRLFYERIKWHAAKKRCEEMGGYLVCIESAEENDFLYDKIKNLSGAFFIGATDEAKEGSWEWVNGSRFEYANWYRGEPNNSQGIENYAAFGPASCGAMWNDLSTFSTKGRFITTGFICEWNTPVPGNKPVTDAKPVSETVVEKSPDLAEFEEQLDFVEKSFWVAASQTRNDHFFKSFDKKLFDLVVLSRSIQSRLVDQHLNNAATNMPKQMMRLTEVWKKFAGKGPYKHRKLRCTSRRSYGLYRQGGKADYILWLENTMLQNINSFNSKEDGAINTKITDYYMAIKELRVAIVELSGLGIFAENSQVSIPDKLNEITSGGEPANGNGKAKTK